jgi:DNA invertase Pin-like site-specific DNA recombinase
MESNVPFLAPDNPHATNFTIHILAAVAKHEAKQRSARTRAALAQSKKKLGGYRGRPGRPPSSRLGSAAVRAKADAFTARVRPTIEAMRADGKSLHQIAAELTARGVMTSRGGQWDATRVRNVLARAGSAPH